MLVLPLRTDQSAFSEKRGRIPIVFGRGSWVEDEGVWDAERDIDGIWKVTYYQLHTREKRPKIYFESDDVSVM